MELFSDEDLYILECVVKGQPRKKIAKHLSLSEATINSRISKACVQLGANNVVHLSAIVVALRLVEVDIPTKARRLFDKYQQTKLLPDWIFDLTKSERRVVTLVCKGNTNKEICDELFVGYESLRSHLRSIYHKLNLLGSGFEKRQTLKGMLQSTEVDILYNMLKQEQARS